MHLSITEFIRAVQVRIASQTVQLHSSKIFIFSSFPWLPGLYRYILSVVHGYLGYIDTIQSVFHGYLGYVDAY